MRRYERRISAALGGRSLVWLGPRGVDGRPLARLPELSAAFGTIAELDGPSAPPTTLSLERLSGARPDFDSHDFELRRQPAYAEYRDAVAATLAEPSVLFSWGPSHLAAELLERGSGRLTLASIPTGRLFQLDDKRLVGAQLERIGVEDLGWRELPPAGESKVAEMLNEGPCVVRARRTQAGQGLWQVRGPEELAAVPFGERSGELAVAPLLEPALPLNVSACIFRDGSLRLHPPSVQLIGIPQCTAHPFGYCGNDFALPRSLERAELDSLEALLRRVASWLAGQGYVGGFGLDALLHEGAARFVEINPRLQGSSLLSARIADALGVPSLHLDHLAAVLGLAPEGEAPALADWAASAPELSGVLVHNLEPAPVRASRDSAEEDDDSLLAPVGTVLAPGATLGRAILGESVTDDGRSLSSTAALGTVDALRDAHSPAPPAGAEGSGLGAISALAHLTPGG